MYAYVHPLGSDNIEQVFINQGTLYVMVKLIQPKYSMMSFAKHMKSTALTAKSGSLPFSQSSNLTNETSLTPIPIHSVRLVLLYQSKFITKQKNYY